MNLNKVVARATIACVIGLPVVGVSIGVASAAPGDDSSQQNVSAPPLDLSKVDLSELRTMDLSHVDFSQLPPDLQELQQQMQRDAENFQLPQLPNVSIPSIPTPPLLLPPPDFHLPELPPFEPPPPPPPPAPKFFRLPWEPKLPWELF